MKACGISVFQLTFLTTLFLVPPCVFAGDEGASKMNSADPEVDAEIVAASATKSAAESEARFKLTEEVVEREMDAEEDPMARQQSEQVEAPEDEVPAADEIRFYGSVRLRYRDSGLGVFRSDGGSRLGVDGQWQVGPDSLIFGRFEIGINVLDTADLLFNPGDRPQGEKFSDHAFLRLVYAGIETPDYILAVGKNWSSYYRVTSFTDRFQGTGASASGTFNANTDGGYTGTGRADNVIQARLWTSDFADASLLKQMTLNMQLQHGEPIPILDDYNYGTAFGVSTVMETITGMGIGIAYNRAYIDSADLPALAANGIEGDAMALAVGLRWFGEDWYLGTVRSRLKNHESTLDGIYFDGVGWELYLQYRLYKRWWAVAGFNQLTPDDSETQVGEFEVDYDIIGLRYSFNEFRQMIYANVRLESSRSRDGEELDNVYTVGVRWDLP